jgi:hypothetical protein
VYLVRSCSRSNTWGTLRRREPSVSSVGIGRCHHRAPTLRRTNQTERYSATLTREKISRLRVAASDWLGLELPTQQVT